VASAKALFTLGADGTVAQVLGFSPAPLDGWLDTWGLLFGIPRQTPESNANYAARLSETVLAWVGTLPAVQVWVDLFATGGTIVENPTVGYIVNFPAGMSSQQVAAFLASFNRIRPVGVPFQIFQMAAGLILDTDAFLGSGSRVAGDYLTAGVRALPFLQGPVTLSAKRMLSAYLIFDPVLNPGLTL
jgi:hypothetical protein